MEKKRQNEPMDLIQALGLASLALTATMGTMPKPVGFHKDLRNARVLLSGLKEILKELESDIMLSAEQKRACIAVFGPELAQKIIRGAEGKPVTEVTTKDIVKPTLASGAEHFYQNTHKNGSLPQQLGNYKPTLSVNSQFKYKK